MCHVCISFLLYKKTRIGSVSQQSNNNPKFKGQHVIELKNLVILCQQKLHMKQTISLHSVIQQCQMC